MGAAGPDVRELIRRARTGDAEALGSLLALYRSDLRNRAEGQLQQRVAGRVDASDVVQQACLDAHRGFGQFRGGEEVEFLAWLQRILDHHVAGVIRQHVLLQKRDVRREKSLDVPPGSRATPQDQLNADYSTPSQRAMKHEEEDRLERALAQLPRDQQEVVRLRHLQGKTLAEIAEQIGRSRAATASLLQRGLEALRRRLDNSGPGSPGVS